MPMVDLDSVYVTRAKGRVYHYAWRGKGAPRLRGEPGSPEYIAQLAEALAGRKTGDRSKISGLCAQVRASDEWKALAPGTRANWSPWLDRFQKKFGVLSIAQLDRAKVMKPRLKAWLATWKATPRTRDMGKQAISWILSFAVNEGLLTDNIILGLPNLYHSDRADLIWEDPDWTRLRAEASRDIWNASQLAAKTGLREGDLIRLGPAHVKALSIEIATGKSSERRTTLIPIYADLRALLEEIAAYERDKRARLVREARAAGKPIPPAAATLLTTSRGKPWTKGGFGSSWNKTLTEVAATKTTPRIAWTDLHFHDMRGNAATAFYLAGLKVRVIAEILAWSEDKVERILNRYVRKNAMLLDTIRQMDEASQGAKA